MWIEHDLVMIPVDYTKDNWRTIISIDSFGKMFGQKIDTNIVFKDCIK